MNSFNVYEVELSDIKLSEDHSKNESLAKAREEFIKEYGPVNMMVLSASLELLLHPEIYYVLLASGVKKANAIVVTTPEDANQHVRNLFGMISGTYAGKAEWLERNQPYYKEGGAGYFLRMGDTKADDEKSLKHYLGAFINLSHTSVQKLLDISRSEGGPALLSNIDEGKCSLDRAYRICKTGTSVEDDNNPDMESEATQQVKPKNRSVAVLGGNTPGHNLEKGAKVTVMMKFAEMAQELAEVLSETSADGACSIKAHKDRKGKLESYSCTHETGDGVLTFIFKPNGKEVSNGNA